MATPVSAPMSASDILDREFLELRAKVLQLAASFDRMTRAEGSTTDDPRRALLRQGIQVLLHDDEDDRAEQVQLIFSRQYDPAWRDQFGLPSD